MGGEGESKGEGEGKGTGEGEDEANISCVQDDSFINLMMLSPTCLDPAGVLCKGGN